MGKLTLLFVLAAILGGSMLAYSTRALAGGTARRHSESQADQISRQIADTGRNLALARMAAADGFVDPGIGRQPYDGGTYEVVFAGSPDRQSATLTVRGSAGGATHTIVSEYAFDPLDLPAPVWIDAPYTTAAVNGSPTLDRGPHPRSVAFDRRLYDDLGLASVVRLDRLESNFNAALGSVARLSVPASGEWNQNRNGLLEDVNVGDAEDLYQSVLAAMVASDHTLPAGNQTITNSRSWGNATTITRVRGNLTVASGGSVSGRGVLLVEGGLVVQSGGRLTWSGLVLVRGDRPSLPVTFDGTVSLTGGLVVRQDPATPLGHLDVTIWRDQNGLSAPAGRHQVAPWTARPGMFPWTQHTHQFDKEYAEGRHVYFVEGGAEGRHEGAMQFHAALAAAGSDEVLLEFTNASEHGFGRLALDIQTLGAHTGTVRWGFPAALRSAANAHETRPFRADRLRDFSIDLRSLSALKRRFDTEDGCTLWPFCVGSQWGRGSALTLRLRRASDRALLYEAGFYWHMRVDEKAAHDAAVQAFRDEIATNNGFGTNLRFGNATTIRYARAPLLALAERLDWDGNEIVLISTVSRHQTAAEARAAGTRTNAPPPGTGTGSTAPDCPDPARRVKVCRPPTGGDSSWNEVEMRCDQVAAYLAATPGAILGTCSDAGR